VSPASLKFFFFFFFSVLGARSLVTRITPNPHFQANEVSLIFTRLPGISFPEAPIQPTKTPVVFHFFFFLLETPSVLFRISFLALLPSSPSEFFFLVELVGSRLMSSFCHSLSLLENTDFSPFCLVR